MPVVANRERGCGFRIAGGVYWETDPELVASSMLNEWVPIDMQAVGLTFVGTKMIERNGVWHVLDYVGAESYPSISVFQNEALEMGISRRVSWTHPLQRLTSESRLLLVSRVATGQDVIFMSCPLSRLVLVEDHVDPLNSSGVALSLSFRGVNFRIVEV